MSRGPRGESYDGTVGEVYLRPASHTKGQREEPAWRDPDYAKQNWAACRVALKRYGKALLLPVLPLLFGTGYAMGLIDGLAMSRPETLNEGNTK